MRTFKTKAFARFARKAGLTNQALVDAIKPVSAGLIDAELGGNIIKQRIAREGGGKSGGFRTIIVFKAGDRAIFVHGFSKTDTANITPAELAAFKLLAVQLLGLKPKALEAAINMGVIMEIKNA